MQHSYFDLGLFLIADFDCAFSSAFGSSDGGIYRKPAKPTGFKDTGFSFVVLSFEPLVMLIYPQKLPAIIPYIKIAEILCIKIAENLTPAVELVKIIHALEVWRLQSHDDRQ